MSAEELARRAVACKGWRWLGGERQLLKRQDGNWTTGRRVAPTPYVGALPDLDDPATLGCLLALVREAWFGVLTHGVRAGGVLINGVCSRPDGYNAAIEYYTVTVVNGPSVRGRFATEAEALVCALEAAP